MSSAVAAASIGKFIAAVGLVVEPDGVHLGDLDGFCVDGIVPQVEVEPRTLDQLQAVLTEAAKAGLTVIPMGGATQLSAGNVPRRYDLALSLARMDRVAAYEPADLVITVEAGMRLLDLQATLRTQRQCLPVDPPCLPGATVGGLIATNASGPLRHAHGTVRDWLIGTRVVHPDGASTKSGGRVVKNVAGYDMHKLYVGSLGTLGVIAEATFKLAPLPPVQTTVSAAFASAASACAFVHRAHDAGLSLHAAEVLAPRTADALLHSTRWHLLARVAGGQSAIDRSVADLRHYAADAHGAIDTGISEDVWDRWAALFALAALSIRLCVMPSETARAIVAVEAALDDVSAYLSATVSAGVIRINAATANDASAAALISSVRNIADSIGGTMIVDAAPAEVKRAIDVFGPTRSDFSIMQRLKHEFDPDGVLAPGRFVGEL